MVAYIWCMQSWAEQQLANLRPQYEGRWQIWVVPRYCQTTVWCARPKGSPIATINADSPEHLIEEIRRQEYETP